jgi:hypothetical protein
MFDRWHDQAFWFLAIDDEQKDVKRRTTKTLSYEDSLISKIEPDEID